MKRFKQIIRGAALTLVLTVTASAGFVLVSGALAEIVGGLIEAGEPPLSSYSERLVINKEGTPIIYRSQGPPFRKIEVFDIQRQRIDSSLNEEGNLLANLPLATSRYPHWLRRYYRWSRVRRVHPKGPADENWYIVFDGNYSQRFYLQGLHVDGGETIGYIGREGFQETKPDEENLFQNGPLQLEARLDRSLSTGENSLVFVLDDQHLLSVDIARRTLHR